MTPEFGKPKRQKKINMRKALLLEAKSLLQRAYSTILWVVPLQGTQWKVMYFTYASSVVGAVSRPLLTKGQVVIEWFILNIFYCFFWLNAGFFAILHCRQLSAWKTINIVVNGKTSPGKKCAFLLSACLNYGYTLSPKPSLISSSVLNIHKWGWNSRFTQPSIQFKYYRISLSQNDSLWRSSKLLLLFLMRIDWQIVLLQDKKPGQLQKVITEDLLGSHKWTSLLILLRFTLGESLMWTSTQCCSTRIHSTNTFSFWIWSLWRWIPWSTLSIIWKFMPFFNSVSWDPFQRA